MTNGKSHRKQLRFGFYTDTFMYRSEVFFYRQAVGMQHAHVQVLARQGALLDEFPVDDLYLVDEFRDFPTRIRMGIERRLDRSSRTVDRMQKYVRRRLVRQLTRDPVDVLYTMFGWHAVQLLDVMDAMDYQVPLVYFAGGSDVIAASSYGEAYVRRLDDVLQRSTLILATSDFVACRLAAMNAPVDRLRRLYLGVDVDKSVVPGSRDRGEHFRIVAVSRLSSVKGLRHTVRTFSEVLKAVPNAAFDIIGDGEERLELEALVRTLGLDDHVTFHGSKSLKYVYRALEEADVFVQHSIPTPEGREEAMGVSVLEASAHALPVVVTRTGGIPEGVIDGETGYLVRPGDEAGMAAYIVRLANDRALRRRMGAAGREYMFRKFDVRKQNAKLEVMLTEVAHNHRRPNG